MSSVVSRTFRSSPHRSGSETWDAIIALLGRGKSTPAVDELNSVRGTATMLIIEQSFKEAPMVVTCDGPRTRVRCVYDDEALDDSAADENPLGFDPLQGDWEVSLPCPAEDLEWVQRALREKSTRINARDAAQGIALPETAAKSAALGVQVDLKELLK